MEKFKKIATPKRLLALAILILVLIFAFQNLKPVSLNLVFFSLNIPLLLLIVVHPLFYAVPKIVIFYLSHTIEFTILNF